MCIFQENHDRIYTELTLTLKAPITTSRRLSSSKEMFFEASLTNSVDPDQTALASSLF